MRITHIRIGNKFDRVEGVIILKPCQNCLFEIASCFRDCQLQWMGGLLKSNISRFVSDLVVVSLQEGRGGTCFKN